MSIDPRLVNVLGLQVVSGGAPALGAEAPAPHIAFQTSTLEALVDGTWDGDLSIGQLRSHGSLGLGTFDSLDGEMVLVDGECYRATSHGTIVRVGEAEGTPFAVVTPFAPTVALKVGDELDYGRLLWTASAAADNFGGAYAIRFDGMLADVQARSVPLQMKPYPTMEEIAEAQCHFTIGPTQGTLIGFWFPSWVNGIQLPGFHMHAITADRRIGGHVLQARVGPGTLRLDPLFGLDVHLPRHVELPAGVLDGERANIVARLEAGGS
ncbi:MAG TPA: acetolactate decarboxylase [Conexibacter sp.]|jgi:acetolactate decarboxylase